MEGAQTTSSHEYHHGNVPNRQVLEPVHQKSNFILPIPIHGLESELVRLVPFEPLRHASTFYAASAPHPTLCRYLPFGPFKTREDFLAWHRTWIEDDVGSFLFAVLDKSAAPTQPAPVSPLNTLNPDSSDTVTSDSLAGIIGYLNTNPQHATTEIGYLIILPCFQGTHVARHAIGLLLRYALNLPGNVESGGMSEQTRTSGIEGLGLRRVQYQANVSNVRSIRAAERVGFMKEGVIRWQRVLGLGKEGKSGRGGELAWVGAREGVEAREDGWGPGRDTVLLAVCWDDWENGVKERVDCLMRGVRSMSLGVPVGV